MRYFSTIILVLLVTPCWANVLQSQSSFAVRSPIEPAISPDNAQIYVASLQGNAIEVLNRDADTGKLTTLVTKSGEVGLVYPWRVLLSSDGEFVYVITHGSLHPSTPTLDALLVFKRGGDGKLTIVETLQNDIGGISAMLLPSDLALSVSGDQLYVRAAGSSSLLIFNRDAVTGKLTLLQTLLDSEANIVGLNGDGWLVTSTDDRFVYTTSINDNSVTVFARDVSTEKFTLVKSYIDGGDGISGLKGAWGVALSPDQRHLYVSGGSNGSIVVFARDGATGMLSFAEAYKQGDLNKAGDTTRSFDGLSHPAAVKVSPDGQRIYVSGDEFGNPDPVSTLAVLRRDPADGSLSFVEVHRSSSASTFFGLGGVVHFALTSDGAFLYSAGNIDGYIGVFSHLAADLSLVTLVDIDSVIPGAPVNYTLTVTNNSTGAAQGVALSDLLPSDTTFISVDTSNCLFLSPVLKCEIGNMAGGAQAVIKVQVNAPSVEGSIRNVAMVYSEYNDMNPTDNNFLTDTVVANITPNNPPIAVNDLIKTVPGKSVTFNVLTNDSDIDNDTLSLVSVAKKSDATQGTLTIDVASSEVIYAPPVKQNGKDYSGTENFVYRISDSFGAEAEGLITIIVNTLPLAVNDQATVVQGGSVQILVLANDSDPDEDNIQLVSIDDTTLTSGSVQLNDDGTLTYVSDATFIGKQTFSYTIEDSNAAVASAHVTVSVLATGADAGGDINKPIPDVNVGSNNNGGGAVETIFLTLLSFLLFLRFLRSYRLQG